MVYIISLDRLPTFSGYSKVDLAVVLSIQLLVPSLVVV
jgi:hypothetical protein